MRPQSACGVVGVHITSKSGNAHVDDDGGASSDISNERRLWKASCMLEAGLASSTRACQSPSGTSELSSAARSRLRCCASAGDRSTSMPLVVGSGDAGDASVGIVMDFLMERRSVSAA